MTIFTLDVSNHDYDRGPINWQSVRGAGIEVAIAKASEGDPAGYHYTDPWFVRAVTDANAAGLALMGGYHCLAAGDVTSINRQVDWLISRAGEVGGVAKGWWMLDIEPFTELTSRGMAPRLSDVLAFESRWMSLTGQPIAHYLPHWYWTQWGSPDLSAIRGPVVSSNYPVTATMAFDQLYARDGGDSGPGWAPYGGKTPTLWQFGSSNAVPGVVGNCDANAFKGTLDQLIPLLGGVRLVSTPPTPITPVSGGDPIMSALPTLQQGSLGPTVKNLQALLNTHGYGLAVDGQFGPLTRGATVKFQTAMHIGVDGIVGQHTWSCLLLGHDL